LYHGLRHLVETIAREADDARAAGEPTSPPVHPEGAGSGRPAVERPVGRSRQADEKRMPVPELTHGKHWTVLYIEDDVDAADAMRLRLESLGLHVVQAFDGAEGYRLAVARSPDLIVCDYVLPGGNGDYVLRRLRENPATESIPVIFVTGRPGSELPRRLYGQGAAGYLKKPISSEDLTEALSATLGVSLREPVEAAR
jgi:CheY-like chemotaxis protein